MRRSGPRRSPTLSNRDVWAADLIRKLEGSGRVGTQTARYLRTHAIALAIHDQPTGARWTLRRRIELHPRFEKTGRDTPYALSLIVHEVEHLRQGLLTALSVYGELAAWQLQFRFLRRVAGRAGVPGSPQIIDQILALPPGWDRAVLRRARDLMREYAGTQYRIDLLPLYPLHREALHMIAGMKPT